MSVQEGSVYICLGVCPASDPSGWCLSGYLAGRGGSVFLVVSCAGVVCQAVGSSLSLAGDPSIQLWTDPLKVWLSRGMAIYLSRLVSICLSAHLKIFLPVCLKSAYLAVGMPSLDLSEWWGSPSVFVRVHPSPCVIS